MNFKLVVVGGDVETPEVPLKLLPALIGRGREAALVLPHPLVSRRHCEIYQRDGELFVRDLGSLNGTYVGKDRVEDAPLPPGALLTVGTVTFRAVYEDLPADEHQQPTAGDMPWQLSSDGLDTEQAAPQPPGNGPADLQKTVHQPERASSGPSPAERRDEPAP